MSREARRREPALRPKTRLEVSDSHLSIRVVCVVVAIVVAALAFGAVINGLLSAPAGWQQIEAVNSKTGIDQEFLLCYNLGQTEQDASVEKKAVAALYTQLLDGAYRVLSNTQQESEINLYTLNHQPNTALTVDPLLYGALQTLEESGSRLPYFAPLMTTYQNYFQNIYEDAGEQYEQFRREIAAFAMDSDAVQVKLLPENTVRLEISPEYLDYARENEVEHFLDFGILLNAFLCDAVAQGLEEQGYVNGYVTSFDGYARSLCAEQLGLNVFDLVEGTAAQLGTVTYTGPGSLVSCRSFPILEQDSVNYFTCSDGTILAPYLNDQGQLHAAAASLSTFDQGTAAALALRTLAAYAGEDDTFAALDDLSWVSGANGQITLHGQAFQLAE